MRAVELLQEAKVGREFQHLEDLVFIDGSKGVARIVEYLTHMAKEATGRDYSLKWDGIPTVYWGREPDGTFVFVGKNNWDKADQGGFATSPEELRHFILSRGKGEEWREQMANELAESWHIFEAGTPEKFRGYFFGDLLFHPGKPFEVQRQQLIFTPNKVTYLVPIDQELGLMLFRARAAVAVHKYFRRFGDTTESKMPKLQQFSTSQGTYYPSASTQLAVLGPYFADNAAKIDMALIKQLADYARKNARQLDEFLSSVPGLTSIAAEIYTYHNQQSKAGNLDDLAPGFLPWAQSTLGPKKLAALQQKLTSNPGGFEAMWKLIEAVRLIKNQVIDQLDQATPQLRTLTGNEPGGEGWVYRDTKLVARHRWKPPS